MHITEHPVETGTGRFVFELGTIEKGSAVRVRERSTYRMLYLGEAPMVSVVRPGAS